MPVKHGTTVDALHQTAAGIAATFSDGAVTTLTQRVVYGARFESDIELSDEAVVEMLCDMTAFYRRERQRR